MSDETQYTRDRVAFVQHGRPAFFEDPAVDKLLAVSMALLGEVCVLRERLDAHEQLAAAGQVPAPASVDAFVPGAAAAAQRDAVREQIMARVLSALTEDVVRLRHERRPE
jgi:hypothetical protein